MLYMLWGFLNLGLLVFFVSICFRAAKLIREHIGLFASIVFVFGLLSFVGTSVDKDETGIRVNNQVKKWTFKSKSEIIPDTWKYVSIPIDKTPWLSSVDLGVAYGHEKLSMKPIPLEATSTTSGFVNGHRWRPIAITVNLTATLEQLTYHVDGLLEWNLLGTTIYVQHKTYSGFIEIN